MRKLRALPPTEPSPDPPEWFAILGAIDGQGGAFPDDELAELDARLGNYAPTPRLIDGYEALLQFDPAGGFDLLRGWQMAIPGGKETDPSGIGGPSLGDAELAEIHRISAAPLEMFLLWENSD